MGQEQPALSIDGPAVNAKADEKKGLADHLYAAADAVTVTAVMMSLRNPGSLFGKIQESVLGQIWRMGTRLTAARLVQSAMSSDGAVDEFQTAESQAVSGPLQEIEDITST